MPKILVLFYSRTGNTAALADAITEGANSVRFAEVDARRLDDLAPTSVIESIPEWKSGRETLMARYQTFSDVNTLGARRSPRCPRRPADTRPRSGRSWRRWPTWG